MEYFGIFFFFAFVILGILLLRALKVDVPGVGVYFHISRGVDGLKISAGVEIEGDKVGGS